MALLLAAPAAVAEGVPEGILLRPGAPIERALEAGGRDLFDAELAAGKHWLLRVEQLGINVVVEVRNPQGQSLLAVDSPLGRAGAESLLLTPAITGHYAVEVRCDQRGALAGRYQIRLEELPAVTTMDRLRLRAEGALSDAGRFYREGSDQARGRASVKLRQALGDWRALRKKQREAWTWLFLGGLEDEREDFVSSVASYERALALWRQLDEREGMAVALDRLGLTHKHLGENHQAVAELEEALALRQGLGQREREVETRNHLCLIHQKLGRFRAAAECYRKTLALAREVSGKPLVATLLNNLGGISSNLGEPDDALGYYRKALQLRRSLGDEMGEAITLNNLGAFHRGLGEVEEALLLYAPALAIFQRLGNRYWQARTLNNIGFAYLTLGELERARAYLLRALPLRREVGDSSGKSVTLLNLGRTLAGLGQTGKALAFYRQALDHNLAVDNRRGRATARGLLGELHLEGDEFALARDQLELALADLRQMGNRPREAEVLELLSRARLGLGETGEAKDLVAKALALHRAVRNPVGEVQALTTLARAERALGNPVAERAAIEAALEAVETLQGRLGDPNQRASFVATQREVYELHVDFLVGLHRKSPLQGYDLAALEASERARSRSLLTLLEGSAEGLASGAESALAHRLRLAQQRFAAKTRRQLAVNGREHGAAEALAAEQELFAALAELDNIRAELRRRDPRAAALRRPQTLTSVAIRELLDEETVLLEFFLGEERSFLWWVTPTAVTVHELPPRRRIEELASRVHQQISAVHQPRAEGKAALEALGWMLLAPVAQRLDRQRLVIVPDGALHFVPFAALTLPSTGALPAVPVLVRHEVVYLPSASVLAVQRRELAARRMEAQPTSTVGPKTVAILADPIFSRGDPRLAKDSTEAVRGVSPGIQGPSQPPADLRGATRSGLEALDRLPHTRREAEAIAALVPASRRFLALGGEARRSRVVGDQLSGYRILHFATHGLVNPRTPELSGLVLSRHDARGGELVGFLGFDDVANLQLSAELVVLSGCRTALGKQIRGEGLVGLTRGFLYAGVPRVVASLWQVRDRATADLMTHFYRAMLVEGLPAAAALRGAQLALRQDRRYRDPYYWAAFSLQGDWR